MTIQDLGSVGELIAAIATIATLAYLAIQIRQSAKVARANLAKDILLASRAALLEIAANEQLAEIAAGKSSDLGAGETLAQFDNSAPIDNMEGVSVERRKDGKMILTLISDDNFNAFQRTVLLQFLAEPAR